MKVWCSLTEQICSTLPYSKMWVKILNAKSIPKTIEVAPLRRFLIILLLHERMQLLHRTQKSQDFGGFWRRVRVPILERFLAILYCSILLNKFFVIFVLRIYTFDVLCLCARGKTAKNIFLSWSFCPHFFYRQGVPN